ncbi:MAG: UDP-N-acetylglucosamine 1-carboxyvinyltransferase, partial [Acidobacteriota bacterium]
MVRVLEHLGANAERGEGSLKIRIASIATPQAPYDLVRTMRASILTLGPLLARHGMARVSLPGGCAIGARPVDLHVDVMRAMGAQVDLQHGYIHARARRLQSADYSFDRVTVTGTENAMMAAALASGTTVLRNCAREPEVVDLARLLARMGAPISGAGESCIRIEGADRLHGASHDIVPDRIEAGTFMVAGALAGGRVKVENCRPEHLSSLLERLARCGVCCRVGPTWVEVDGDGDLVSQDVKTGSYPGFPTDLQAQYMVLMTQARGRAVISETVFENRFMHVLELKRLGAGIRVEGHRALVEGETALSGAQVMATDLRASASLVLAGLVAAGETLIGRVYHLDRGYSRIEAKLKALGAEIERI